MKKTKLSLDRPRASMRPLAWALCLAGMGAQAAEPAAQAASAAAPEAAASAVAPASAPAPAPAPSVAAVPAVAKAVAPATDAGTLGLVVVSSELGKNTNTVVRKKRIEVAQAQSVQDLFQQTPEVSTSGSLPVAQKLYVRGLSERMLNITIDGATQPESAYHHTGQIMIEPELLKRVELEAGTGAATAGPGALGGALRFTTKSALDMLRPDERAGGLLRGGYFSNGDAVKLSGTAFGRLTNEIDLLASVTDFNSDDYQDGNGRTVPNSAARIKGHFVKAGARIDADQRMEISHEARADEGLRAKRTNLLPAAFNAVERQSSTRYSSVINHTYTPDNPLVALSTTLYANTNGVGLGLNKAAPEQHGTRSRGVNLANVSTLGGHAVSYGWNYRRDTGHSSVTGQTLADETASVNGVYLQDDMALAKSLQLSVGARYDRYDYTDILGQRYQSSGASPSASLSYAPIEMLTLRLSHAQALRGVGIIEPYLKQYQDNAAQIEPEKARTTQFSTIFAQGPWNATATVYDQDISNYIGYDDFRQNMGDVTVKGYSASVGYKGKTSGVSLGVAESRPRLNDVPLVDGDSLLLGNATGRTWVLQLDQQFPSMNFSMGWTTRLVEELTHVPPGNATKAGYSVSDAYAQWLPFGRDDVTLTLTVKNIFDRMYYEQASFGYHPRWGQVAGLPEAGRDVRVSAAWRF